MPGQRLIDEYQMQGVIDALFAISHSLKDVAGALNFLGIARQGEQLGAIEVMSMEIKEGLSDIATAIRSEE